VVHLGSPTGILWLVPSAGCSGCGHCTVLRCSTQMTQLLSCLRHPPFDDEKMEETITEGNGCVFCFEGREYDLE
jgi:hypothetical protein